MTGSQVPTRNNVTWDMLEFEKSLPGWILRVIRNSGQVASDSRNSLPDDFECVFSHTFINTI